MKHMTLLYAGLVVAASQVFAETAFRSVDEQGNVTFSDEPVSDAVQQEQTQMAGVADEAGVSLCAVWPERRRGAGGPHRARLPGA